MLGIVEVVSDTSFAEYLQTHVLDPCGMKDTTFWPTPAQAKRIATSYRPDSNGKLQPMEVYFLKGGLQSQTHTSSRRRPLLHRGRCGGVYQMMLNGGTFKGKSFAENRALMTVRKPATLKLALSTA